MSVKKIVFLSSSEADVLTQLDKIREYEQNSEWTVVVIATRYSAQRMCRQHGLPYKTSIDYLTKERHYRAYTESTRLAMEWYKHPMIEKTLSHDGVLLGEIIEYDIRSLIAGFFMDIELYQGILEIEKPDKIIAVKSISPELVTKNPMDMSVYEEFIISSLSKEKSVSLELLGITPENIAKSQKEASLRPSAFIRAFDAIKAKLMNYLGAFLFVDWRIEMRRDLQKLWHYLFCSWKARRVKRLFSIKKRKIAFLNLRCASNVADYLKKDSDNGVVFLMGPGQTQRAVSFLPAIYLESFSTPEINNIVEEKRQLFKSILEQTELVSYLQAKFTYNGFSFWEVAGKKFEYILNIHLPLVVRGMELTKEMIGSIGLDIFISSSGVNPVIRAMTRVMQHKGKKTLLIPHGIDYFTPEASELFGKSLVPPYADKLAIWGEASKEWFIGQGAPPNSIEVTSCSDFDDYLKLLNHSQGSLRRYLGIPPDIKVVLYTLDHANRGVRHPYIVETRDEILRHLMDIAQEIARIPRLYLIVRPHPGDEHPEEISQILRDLRASNVSFSASGRSLIYYYQAADILVTHTSSTALEAMIFDKDVIIYNPTGRPEMVPFAQNGAAIKVDSRDTLVSSLTKMLEDNSLRTQLDAARKQFVNRCAGPLDGNATRNIAELILKMVGD
jgi:CDP-glycerol glycerophosphotransferase (TagB/SpsB family)